MDFTGSVRFAGVTYDFQLPEHVLRDNGWFSSHNVISHPFAEENYTATGIVICFRRAL